MCRVILYGFSGPGKIWPGSRDTEAAETYEERGVYVHLKDTY